jgi:phosphate transport system permease protein
LLVYELIWRSEPARAKFGWGFLSSSEWNPVTENFGGLPFLYGTVVTSVVAMLLSIPLGVGAAIFLAELAPAKLSNALTFVIELLAAIPSVIYGLLAIFTLVPLMREYIEPFLKATLGFLPFFQGPAAGVGYLTAGLVLAIMTVPFIISVSRESLLAVPREQREAALALGATHWETTWQIVVPYAKLGILGSVFLGLARALGETMAVTMVIGNLVAVHASLLWPGYSIAAVIANEFAEAGGKIYPAALVELGLVLFGLTIVINGFARMMIIATTKKGSKR